VVFHPDARQASSIRTTRTFLPNSNLCLEAFELLSVASVRTSPQHVWTPFSVGFPFQMQIWEDSCNCLDDVVFLPNTILDKANCAEDLQPSGLQSPLSRRSDLIMEIACSRSATVRMLGQHRLKVAPIWYCVKRVMKSQLHSCPSGRSQLPSGRRLEKSISDLF